MAKRLALLLVCGAAVSVLPGAAEACSPLGDHEPTLSERSVQARRTLAEATAVYDGEVVEPAFRDDRAKVRVVRRFKGPDVAYFYVGTGNDSCAIMFTRAGEHWRFVLSGGPEVYVTFEDYSNERAIDRLLKSDRRKDWPLNPGD